MRSFVKVLNTFSVSKSIENYLRKMFQKMFELSFDFNLIDFILISARDVLKFINDNFQFEACSVLEDF